MPTIRNETQEVGHDMEHSEPIYSVVYSPDGGRLASTDREGTLCVWDLSTGQLTASAQAGRARSMLRVAGVQFSPDGGRVATGTKKITVWDANTGKRALQLEGHPKGEITDMVWTPGGQLISASGKTVQGAKNEVALWDVDGGERIRSWVLLPEGSKKRLVVSRLAMSSDGRRVAAESWSSAAGRYITVLDINEEEPLAHRKIEDEGSKRGIGFSKEHVLVSMAHSIVRLDPKTLQEVDTLDLQGAPGFVADDATKDGPGVIAVDPSGRRAAVRHHFPDWNKIESFWLIDLETFQVDKLASIAAGRGIFSLGFSPAGTEIAAGVGTEIWRWNAATGERLTE